MKCLIPLLLLATCACHGQQAKKKPEMVGFPSGKTASPPATDQNGYKYQSPSEGKACFLRSQINAGEFDFSIQNYGIQVYRDDSQKITWAYPSQETWNCTKGKWVRDPVDEKKRADHESLVVRANEALTHRKLTDEEFSVINEIVNAWPGNSWNCQGKDCYENAACSNVTTTTAELVTQASFYEPTEEQLHLKYLKSYVKGMTCDAGVRRAYEIMNERILEYLKKQHQ